MKRILALVLALMLLGASSVLAETQYLGFATGGTAGTYYPLGGDIAALWMAKIPDLSITVQSTGGSKANILLLKDGDAEIATVQNDVSYYAYMGDKEFFAGEVIDSFAAIGALYPEVVQIIVAADSGIKTVADLNGKKVGIGALGSGAFFNAVQILANAGLTLDNIEEQHLSFDESSTAFQNLQIDAFFVTSGVPNTAVIEVANKRAINVLGLDEAAMASLQASYSFYVPVTIPAGTYNGVNEDITAPAVSAILICSKNLSEDLVYSLTKVLYENTAELTHAKKAYINSAYAVSAIPANVPYHPGALKYFTEIGLLGK
jgi:uncharacterized protein